MKSILRVLGALAIACVLSILLLTSITWAADPAGDLQAAALAAIAAPNSWLAWGGVIVAGASLICSITPTPGPDSKLYYPYKALELVAFIFGKAKEVGLPRSGLRAIAAVLVLCGTGLTLSACQGAGGVSTVAAQANEIAGQTEATVCKTFGLYSAGKTEFGFKTPNSLEGAEETLAAFCSADPVIGSTPIATLTNLAIMAMRLVSAQAPPRS